MQVEQFHSTPRPMTQTEPRAPVRRGWTTAWFVARRAFGDADCELETMVFGRDGRVLARRGGAHERSVWNRRT